MTSVMSSSALCLDRGHKRAVNAPLIPLKSKAVNFIAHPLSAPLPVPSATSSQAQKMPSSKWLTVFKPKSRSRSQSVSLPLPHKPSRKTLSFASRSARHVSFVKIGRRWLSVVTLGTYTYQGRPRQNSDAGMTFPSGGLAGGRNDGRAWRARSMSMPETPTRIDGNHRQYWVSRLETIDDCTLNSKKVSFAYTVCIVSRSSS